MSAEMIAASPLKPEEAARVSDRLSKSFGKKVNLEVRHDPALLGGVILKIGSQQLDASLAGKIARLKVALQAA
jgi:F-type H+-transporting ATPase subunit delta